MNELEELKKRIEKIEERNTRVESDKRWEISWTRRVSICVLTYIVACLTLIAIGESHLFIKALVPVLGFVLSTVSLRIIRKVVG